MCAGGASQHQFPAAKKVQNLTVNVRRVRIAMMDGACCSEPRQRWDEGSVALERADELELRRATVIRSAMCVQLRANGPTQGLNKALWLKMCFCRSNLCKFGKTTSMSDSATPIHSAIGAIMLSHGYFGTKRPRPMSCSPPSIKEEGNSLCTLWPCT
eukprot:CAMPEP_0176040008 /NCGR_PEP_ID=MMETSP0120_2-20121206/19835_1 /TAXON_ID=160619 /ORGANISM="Kryptoperidinium foliaceum, Strain CCMP 1326" /LENGTH=156 /DNA_ID=CAMNT_0017373403 /DNA_START=30 /DNA_END=498 /DNA_ORIENTATION=-